MRYLTLCALVVTLSSGTTASHPDDFHLTVRDVFTMTNGDNQKLIITGIVEGGTVAVNDVICLRPAEGERRELTVDGIIQARGRREELEAAEPGMIVGLRFEGIEKKDVNVGDTLTAHCD